MDRKEQNKQGGRGSQSMSDVGMRGGRGGRKTRGWKVAEKNSGESSKQKTVTGIKGQHAEQDWRLNE